MKFLPIDNLAIDAWKDVSKHGPSAYAFTPTIEFHHFLPIHGTASAYMVFIANAGYDYTDLTPGNGYVMVRVKFSIRSSKSRGDIKAVSDLIPKPTFLASYIGHVLTLLRGQQCLEWHHTSKDGPILVYTFPSKEEDRYLYVTAQIYITPIEAKAKRTQLEQGILEGISQLRPMIVKDHMRPWINTREPSESEIFASEAENTENVEPMLAYDGKSVEDIVEKLCKLGHHNVFVQPKLDGMRLMAFLRGDRVLMQTRQGICHPIAKHFEDSLKEIFKKLPPGIVLDGELYIHKVPEGLMQHLSSKQVSNANPYIGRLVPMQLGKIPGAAKSYGGTGKATIRNRALVDVLEFHVFTCIAPSLTALERYNLLTTAIHIDTEVVHWTQSGGNWVKTGPQVYLVFANHANTAQDIQQNLDLFLQHGYEGLMIYNADAPYHPGRTWNLIKLKPTETEWFQIVGAQPENGSNGMANLVYFHEGKHCVASGFFSDDAKRLFYVRANEFVGLWALIKFQKITVDSLNGPSLRDPKILYLATKPNEEGDVIELS